MATNRVIGLNNQLPWHLPADLKHFKNVTQGHAVLMGRKTHESIGKPLPNRKNIILTRNPHYQASGCLIVNSLEEAIHLTDKELFIIGGAEIYRAFLPQVEQLYLTLVHQEFEGDAFFPEIDWTEWKEVEREDFSKDEKNECDYSFLKLQRVD